MKSKAFFIIVGFTIPGIIMMPASVFAQDDTELGSQAASLAQQGKFADEIVVLDKILQNHPANPFILEMKANALIALGKNQDALNVLNELIPLADTVPQGFKYYQEKAFALYHLGQFQDAEKAYSEYVNGLSNALSGHVTNSQGFSAMNYVFENIVDEKLGNADQAKFDEDMCYQLSHDTHCKYEKAKLLLQLSDYQALDTLANSMSTNDTDYQQIQELEMYSHNSTKSDTARSSNTTSKIPGWIKNAAKWWHENSISDDQFVQGIQYLIKQNIIHVNQTASTSQAIQHVPAWVKNLAGMWTDNKVSDDDFLKGIEYLVKMGIIRV